MDISGADNERIIGRQAGGRGRQIIDVQHRRHHGDVDGATCETGCPRGQSCTAYRSGYALEIKIDIVLSIGNRYLDGRCSSRRGTCGDQRHGRIVTLDLNSYSSMTSGGKGDPVGSLKSRADPAVTVPLITNSHGSQIRSLPYCDLDRIGAEEGVIGSNCGSAGQNCCSTIAESCRTEGGSFGNSCRRGHYGTGRIRRGQSCLNSSCRCRERIAATDQLQVQGVGFSCAEGGERFKNVETGGDRDLHDIRSKAGVAGGNRCAAGCACRGEDLHAGLECTFRYRDRRGQHLDDGRVTTGDRNLYPTGRCSVRCDEKRHSQCCAEGRIGRSRQVKEPVGDSNIQGFAGVPIGRAIGADRGEADGCAAFELKGAAGTAGRNGQNGRRDCSDGGVGDREIEDCSTGWRWLVKGQGGGYGSVDPYQRAGEGEVAVGNVQDADVSGKAGSRGCQVDRTGGESCFNGKADAGASFRHSY